jgi:hypothetical protein
MVLVLSHFRRIGAAFGAYPASPMQPDTIPRISE